MEVRAIRSKEVLPEIMQERIASTTGRCQESDDKIYDTIAKMKPSLSERLSSGKPPHPRRDMEKNVTTFSSAYSELPMRFCHQKCTKSDTLVKKRSCNNSLHIILPVYIFKILLAKDYI